MNAHFEPPAFIGEVRDQPGDRQDGFACCLRQDEATATRRFEFHDLGNRDLTDLPFHAYALRCTGPSITSMQVPSERHEQGVHDAKALPFSPLWTFADG